MVENECSLRRGALFRELSQHGSALFPLSCYDEDLTSQRVCWHWHDDFEIAFIYEGKCAVSVEGGSFTLGTGEGVFINAGALHELGAASSVCRLRSLVFSPRLIGGVDSIFYQSYALPLLSDSSCRCVRLNTSTDWQRGSLELAKSAWSACADEPYGYELEARYMLSRFVLELLKHGRTASTPSEKARRDAQRAKTMLQYIHEHYADGLTADDIARSASISQSECLRCFRSVLGVTPVAYVRQLRLQRAAELLTGTNEKISEIASRCGFDDTSHFSRIFRHWSGCCPASYRAEHSPSQSRG